MPSDSLSAKQWLEQHPLAAGEHLYVVLGSASDAKPLVRYYQLATPTAPIPIWGGTPYAGWKEVMPYVDQLAADSPMLDWIDGCTDKDWGWLAVSHHSPEVIAEHLRGLTQVIMPDGAEVFFRFWDGRHLLPILTLLGEARGTLLPVFQRYWINGHALPSPGGVVRDIPPYPWWKVPSALLEQLSTADPSTLVDNLMQWLREDHSPLYFALPESNLRLKVEHFVKRAAAPQETLGTRVRAYLEQEVLQ
ncbi:DUF4123 domain-containing protein [Pseudomonas sp.]|uniref:DUF4123 domain-containing protein n=1 Tax=Pseudomonas sp. TaxID=306 RepID=UPI003CC55C5A